MDHVVPVKKVRFLMILDIIRYPCSLPDGNMIQENSFHSLKTRRQG